MRFYRALGIIFCALIAAPASYATEYEDYPLVKLRSLDKITARTMTYEAKVGSTLKFGDLFIKIQSCRKPPPVEKSEAAAFLQIWQQDTAEKKSAKPSSWIFSGWMFASSPSLSGMDHPVYDVWVVDCAGRDPEPIPEPTPEPVPEPTSESASEAVPETSSDEPVTQEAGEPAPVTAPEPAPTIAPREDTPTAPPSPSFEGIY